MMNDGRWMVDGRTELSIMPWRHHSPEFSFVGSRVAFVVLRSWNGMDGDERLNDGELVV
jgi:hypothetical protein